jgi:hypothetical protein
MSEYENYVQDFPCRILKLYEKYLELARLDRLEVTFLLSLTASGIAVPLDRLRPDDRQYPDPFEDRKTFKEAAGKFDELYKKCFRKSELWDQAFEEWQYGIRKNVIREPDSWEELHSAKHIDVSITVERVIRHLRDSLAHGVICTLGDKEIEKILLLIGTKAEAWFLLVTPHNLGIFLRKWVGWLQTLDVSIWKESNSRLKSE